MFTKSSSDGSFSSIFSRAYGASGLMRTESTQNLVSYSSVTVRLGLLMNGSGPNDDSTIFVTTMAPSMTTPPNPIKVHFKIL